MCAVRVWPLRGVCDVCVQVCVCLKGAAGGWCPPPLPIPTIDESSLHGGARTPNKWTKQVLTARQFAIALTTPGDLCRKVQRLGEAYSALAMASQLAEQQQQQQ